MPQARSLCHQTLGCGRGGQRGLWAPRASENLPEQLPGASRGGASGLGLFCVVVSGLSLRRPWVHRAGAPSGDFGLMATVTGIPLACQIFF